MTSHTTEQALEAGIEKALSGLRHQVEKAACYEKQT